MSDSSYPMNYYDSPIDYPDFRGKKDIVRAEVEGENEEAHLIPSTINNTIIFSANKSGKNNTIITNVNKIEKGNNII